MLNVRRFLVTFSIGLGLSFCLTFTLKATERINFIYGPIDSSLGIDSLEEFAETGNVNKELAYYFNIAGANDEQKNAFRESLNKRVDLKNPVYISRFFNSPMGEQVLERIGYILQIRGGRNGKYALRGALVQAALDKEKGFTLMNVFNHLAVNLQLDLEELQIAYQRIERLEKGSRLLLEEMENLSQQEAQQNEAIDFKSLPNLAQAGNYGTPMRQVWTLTDTERNRTFDMIVYQPQRWREGNTPVVVISHGLASRPEDFEERAKHLASYGYFVVLPRHIGSDSRQVEALLGGYSKEIFTVDEFVNRPKDVSYVIDELERRNNPEFGGRLDLKNVGVAGHSFGGYTVLALGGATLNFANLQRVCGQKIWSPNVSLLLQCRLLELPQQDYNLKDERVKAVFAMNPVSGDIFGAEGMKKLTIPVLFAAGTSDPATPAAIEQLKAFVWTASSDKYFALVKGQAHVNFSHLDAQTTAMIESFGNLTIPQQSILDQYGNTYLLAFFEYYLQNNQAYAPYLTSAFSQFISQSPNNLYLVHQEAATPLSQLYNQEKSPYVPPIYPN